MEYLNYLLSFCLGGIATVYLLKYLQKKETTKYVRKIESKFETILSNHSSLIFTKRINDFVYFDYFEWELVYIIKDNGLFIFSGQECLASSTQMGDSEVVEKLIDVINRNWSDDFNKTVVVNNNRFSENLIDKREEESDPILSRIRKTKKKKEMNLDEILDKINVVGYDKLTKREKDFLNNLSK